MSLILLRRRRIRRKENKGKTEASNEINCGDTIVCQERVMDDLHEGSEETDDQNSPVPQSAEERIHEETKSALAGVVDMSPKQRYLRFDESLGKSFLHNSYRAFDTRNGIQVSWHAVHLGDLNPLQHKQVELIVSFQKDVQHKNIIQYMSCWTSEDQNTLNIITTSLDSLKQFSLKKCSRLRWRIVKKWCKQILRGLEFLHTASPVVVHRNLSCSHIYIDGGFGGQGAINLGDLWLSAILDDTADPVQLSSSMLQYLTQDSQVSHIPPEVLEGHPLTTKVDIYSFGMCVLEMLARDEKEPYKECNGDNGRIHRRALNGDMPLILSRITNLEAVDFISKCLKIASERPPASELLQHRFLVGSEEDDDDVMLQTLSDTSFDTDAIPQTGSPTCINTYQESTMPPLCLTTIVTDQLSRTTSDNTQLLDGHELEEPRVRGNSTDVSAIDFIKSSSKGRRLVGFEFGENLYQDKGLHDGRRGDDDTAPEYEISAVAGSIDKPIINGQTVLPSVVGPVAVEEAKSGGQLSEIGGHVTYTLDVSELKADEYMVDMRINTGRSGVPVTAVEFTFNTRTDVVLSVAREMIEELSLSSIPAEELAACMKQKVDLCADEALARRTSIAVVPAVLRRTNGSVDGDAEGITVSSMHSRSDISPVGIGIVNSDDESGPPHHHPGGVQNLGYDVFDAATSMAASSLTMSESSSLSSLEDAHNNNHTVDPVGVNTDGLVQQLNAVLQEQDAAAPVAGEAHEGNGILVHDLGRDIGDSESGTDLGTHTIGDRSSMTHAAVVQVRFKAADTPVSLDDITVSTTEHQGRVGPLDGVRFDRITLKAPIEACEKKSDEVDMPSIVTIELKTSLEAAIDAVADNIVNSVLNELNVEEKEIALQEERKSLLREELGDDREAYQLEIEKLEKECRVAKRTYEQRIQKHKIIQETCEQDIQNLVIDREQKLAAIERKEESLEKYRKKDLLKLQEEFEKAFEEYKKLKIHEFQEQLRKEESAHVMSVIQQQRQHQQQQLEFQNSSVQHARLHLEFQPIEQVPSTSQKMQQQVEYHQQADYQSQAQMTHQNGDISRHNS